MNKATEELNKASHVLLDAEIRLRTVNSQRLQIEKEIAILAFVEANLEENISILRRKRAIVMAHEYKKAMADLNTARNRRALLRIDRDQCLKVEVNTEKEYEKAKAEYELAFERLHNPRSNVIKVNFGSKK